MSVIHVHPFAVRNLRYWCRRPKCCRSTGGKSVKPCRASAQCWKLTMSIYVVLTLEGPHVKAENHEADEPRVQSFAARLSLRKTQGETKPSSLAWPVTNHANTIKYKQLWIHRDSMPQIRKHLRMTSRPCGLAKTACQICQGLATFGLLKMFVSVAWKGHPFCLERYGLSDLPLSSCSMVLRQDTSSVELAAQSFAVFESGRGTQRPSVVLTSSAPEDCVCDWVLLIYRLSFFVHFHTLLCSFPLSWL